MSASTPAPPADPAPRSAECRALGPTARQSAEPALRRRAAARGDSRAHSRRARRFVIPTNRPATRSDANRAKSPRTVATLSQADRHPRHIATHDPSVSPSRRARHSDHGREECHGAGTRRRSANQRGRRLRRRPAASWRWRSADDSEPCTSNYSARIAAARRASAPRSRSSVVAVGVRDGNRRPATGRRDDQGAPDRQREGEIQRPAMYRSLVINTPPERPRLTSNQLKSQGILTKYTAVYSGQKNQPPKRAAGASTRRVWRWTRRCTRASRGNPDCARNRRGRLPRGGLKHAR